MFLLLIIFAGYLISITPNKTIDPNDPNFDPLKFRFEDYKADRRIEEVIKIMFPEGTDKEKIDKILINVAGAKGFEQKFKHPVRQKEYEGQIVYKYHYNNARRKKMDRIYMMPSGEFELRIRALFDEETQKLIRISVLG